MAVQHSNEFIYDQHRVLPYIYSFIIVIARFGPWTRIGWIAFIVFHKAENWFPVVPISSPRSILNDYIYADSNYYLLHKVNEVGGEH